MSDPATSYEQDAAHLAFDLIRQFITIAIGGIGFAVGVHHASPSPASTFMFWSILVVFGSSVVFGLVFLMHGVGLMSQKQSYNVYSAGLRVTAILQILLALIGVILLCSFLCDTPADTSKENIQFKTGGGSLICPLEPDKNYTITVEDGKINFSAVIK